MIAEATAIDVKWWDTIKPKQKYVVELWSPDFRSNEPESYELIAPNKEWAIIQAMSVAYTGETIDPAGILPTDPNDPSSCLPSDENTLEQIENAVNLKNTTVSVNGQPVPDWRKRVHMMIYMECGASVDVNELTEGSLHESTSVRGLPESNKIPTGFVPLNSPELSPDGDFTFSRLRKFDSIPVVLYTDYSGINYFVIKSGGKPYILPLRTD